jgi:hypothetical protein
VTIALGINFGDYALLASDSRVTYYNLDGTVLSYEDNRKKVYKTKIGLITGSGSVDLLDAVKDKLELNEVEDTTAILQVIKEARLNYSKTCGSKAAHDIAHTGWIFTYLANIENKPILRLAMVHPSVGEGIGFFEENKPATIYPFGASQGQVDALRKILEDNIKPFKEFQTLNDSILYHATVIRAFIAGMQPMFSSISPYCQIGVHTWDGYKGISEILKENDPLDFDLERNL